MIEQDEIIEYNSLNEIRLRKELLRKDIQADDAKRKMMCFFMLEFRLSSRLSDTKKGHRRGPTLLTLNLIL